MNWNDIGYKVFWTVVASIAGLVPVIAADWPTWVAPAAIGLANLVLAYARQKVEAKRAASGAAAVLAVLALTAGVVAVTLQPAESSTAHSMSYHCAITRPAGHTVLAASPWTVVNGVVMVDRCRSNNLAVFGDADRCWTVYETTHNRSGYFVC